MGNISWAILVLWVVATFAFAGVAAPYERTHLLASALIAAAALFQGLRHRRPEISPYPQQTPVLVLALLFLAWGVLQRMDFPSAVLSKLAPLTNDLTFGTLSKLGLSPTRATFPITLDPAATSESIAGLLAFGLILVSGIVSFSEQQTRRRVALSIVFVAAFVAFFGMIHRFSGSTKMFWVFTHGWTFFGPYVNTNHAGALLAVAGAIAFSLLARPMSHSDRLGHVLLLGVIALGLLFTGSRAAVLAFSGAILVDLLTRRWKSGASGHWVWIALATVLATAVGWKATFFSRLLATRSSVAQGTEFRPRFWMYAIDLWRESPLSGIGLGAFSKISPMAVADKLWLHPEHVENDYLELLVCTGVIGTLLVLGLIYLLARRLHRVLRDREPSVTRRAFALGTFALALNSIFVFNVPLPAHQILAAILLGGLIASGRHRFLSSRASSVAALLAAVSGLVLGATRMTTRPAPQPERETLVHSDIADSRADRKAKTALLKVEFERAEQDVLADPLSSSGLYRLAFYAAPTQRDRAKFAANAAIRLDPFDIPYRTQVARALRSPDLLERILESSAAIPLTARLELLFDASLFSIAEGKPERTVAWADEALSMEPNDWRTLLLIAHRSPTPVPHLLESWKHAKTLHVAGRFWDEAVTLLFQSQTATFPATNFVQTLCPHRPDVGVFLLRFAAWVPEKDRHCRFPMPDPSAAFQPNTEVTRSNAEWISSDTVRVTVTHAQTSLDAFLLPVEIDPFPTGLSVRMTVESSRPLKEQLVLKLNDRVALTREPARSLGGGRYELAFHSIGAAEAVRAAGPGALITGIGFTPLEKDGRYTLGPIEVFVDSAR